MKGYDVLKGALDGDIEYNTIIRTKNLYEDGWYDYDYYVYGNDNMFHRCNSEGKLGMKYQDRFLNYKVLEKDFEFVLEKEKKIPEKLGINDINTLDLFTKVNEIIDYLKTKENKYEYRRNIKKCSKRKHRS